MLEEWLIMNILKLSNDMKVVTKYWSITKKIPPAVRFEPDLSG